jgi:hypothetical protein
MAREREFFPKWRRDGVRDYVWLKAQSNSVDDSRAEVCASCCGVNLAVAAFGGALFFALRSGIDELAAYVRAKSGFVPHEQAGA